MAALLIGYARVSTDEQDLTAQRDALATLGDRVRGIVDRSAEAEPDLAPRQILEDLTGIGQRAGEPVELGDHKRVTGATCGERLS